MIRLEGNNICLQKGVVKLREEMYPRLHARGLQTMPVCLQNLNLRTGFH